MNRISKHWIVMAVMCGLSAAAIGISANCLGVFYTPMSNELGELRGTLANGSTISSFASAILSLFVLRFMKEDNFKKYLFLGVMMTSLSTALFSTVNSMPYFYALNVIRGMGLAIFGAVVYTSIINNWFSEKLGLATSVVMCFSGVLGALGAPVFNTLISAFGWRISFIVMGVVLFLFCFPALVYNYRMNPESEGLLAYGASEPRKKAVNENKTVKFNYFNVPFISILVFTLFMATFTGIANHLSGFAESIGLGSVVGSFMISLAMIGNISGKLIVGSLSDRIGWFKSILLMMSIVVVAAAILLFTGNALMGYIGSLFIGFNYSVVTVGLVLITKNIFGAENYSKAYPVISFVSSTGSALANSLVAYAYDFTGKYDIVFIAVFIFSIIGFITLITANKMKEKVK